MVPHRLKTQTSGTVIDQRLVSPARSMGPP
jgi:hypothetical protein